jgi:hypothetical protein
MIMTLKIEKERGISATRNHNAGLPLQQRFEYHQKAETEENNLLRDCRQHEKERAKTTESENRSDHHY